MTWGAPWRTPARAPLTVRALLASDELKDLTTDNIMALHAGGGVAASGREYVREQVSNSLLRIDGAIQQLQPEAHQQLDALEVRDEQRASVMGVLRKLGDMRMVALGRAVSQAVETNNREGGDNDALQRRLSDALAPRLRDLAQLDAEISAAAARSTPNRSPIALDRPSQDEREAAARRLAVLDEVNGGVNAHAQLLLESLEGHLGERMPRAPARMLSFFGGNQGTSASNPDNAGKQKFMDCVKAAVPHPTKVAKCIADNVSSVMKMMMNFIKGGNSR